MVSNAEGLRPSARPVQHWRERNVGSLFVREGLQGVADAETIAPAEPWIPAYAGMTERVRPDNGIETWGSQRSAGVPGGISYLQSGQTSKKPSGRLSFLRKYSSCFSGAKFFPHFLHFCILKVAFQFTMVRVSPVSSILMKSVGQM